jgi:hypothetical protein
MTTVIEYTNGQTIRGEEPGEAEFIYLDCGVGRLSLYPGELTSLENRDGVDVETTIYLPDPGTDAAIEFLQAVLAAMEMDDYELVKKQP